jgi:hypothetical protein
MERNELNEMQKNVQCMLIIKKKLTNINDMTIQT